MSSHHPGSGDHPAGGRAIAAGGPAPPGFHRELVRLSPKRRVLTHFLASRLAATGVTVNALAPALSAETGMLPGDPAQLRPQVPVGRAANPARSPNLAAAILANAYLTNQVISLDGGIHPR